ncbi:MAG: beta-lactamase family protein, partial [Deltaproteobacteria bacterium]|nr:beta-lactamase family protein [Deltaproteobacteria bacterium]
SSSGHYFSRKSFGHLGFTGTSFWVDLAKKISIVLLTNRVHPNRENNQIRAFRPIFHNTVMQTIFGRENERQN